MSLLEAGTKRGLSVSGVDGGGETAAKKGRVGGLMWDKEWLLGANLRFLSRGAQGEVWAEEEVAVKFLRFEVGRKTLENYMAKKEAAVCRRLMDLTPEGCIFLGLTEVWGVLKLDKLPPVVEAEMNWKHGAFAIVMRKYATTLGKLKITRPENARRIFGQVAKALAFLHENNYCHCDIKPPNIFLTTNAEDTANAVLGDFGGLTESDGDMCVCGTAKFRAPEVSTSLKKYRDAEADNEPLPPVIKAHKNQDIFALGATMEKVFPTFCPDLVRSMKNDEPSRRPSIGEVIVHLETHSK